MRGVLAVTLAAILARSLAVAAAVTSMAAGCADPASACFGLQRSELIYGEDTRLDVYAVQSAPLARLALQSTVAFIPAEHLMPAADGQFEIAADTLGNVNHLCRDQAFV